MPSQSGRSPGKSAGRIKDRKGKRKEVREGKRNGPPVSGKKGPKRPDSNEDGLYGLARSDLLKVMKPIYGAEDGAGSVRRQQYETPLGFRGSFQEVRRHYIQATALFRVYLCECECGFSGFFDEVEEHEEAVRNPVVKEPEEAPKAPRSVPRVPFPTYYVNTSSGLSEVTAKGPVAPPPQRLGRQLKAWMPNPTPPPAPEPEPPKEPEQQQRRSSTRTPTAPRMNPLIGGGEEPEFDNYLESQKLVHEAKPRARKKRASGASGGAQPPAHEGKDPRPTRRFGKDSPRGTRRRSAPTGREGATGREEPRQQSGPSEVSDDHLIQLYAQRMGLAAAPEFSESSDGGSDGGSDDRGVSMRAAATRSRSRKGSKPKVVNYDSFEWHKSTSEPRPFEGVNMTPR
mmetsp:Transcript_1939/g.4122  ORF Transcript_1939/g.4122 Transcript_1939/m.4122 type:complete len:399 (-) Transcript_1939:346-1542(-)